MMVYDTPRTVEEILSMLAAAPPRLAALSEGLLPAQLLTPPEPGESPPGIPLAAPLAQPATQSLLYWARGAVVRACADMWGQCIAVILSQDRPTIKAVNPTTWIEQTNYRELEFRPSLQAYTTQRAELLAVLKPLARDAWSRTATVTGAGKPLQRSVYTYAQWLANHERTHLKQIERTVTAIRR
jgi:hypothetical protein